MNVPFLSKSAIEAEANPLLSEVSVVDGPIAQPPIPVDEILETHLGLSLDFDNLNKMLGADDILGASWMDTRKVFIDERLDPHEYPQQEGRFNFTLGHEAAHWRLHESYAAANKAQGTLFSEESHHSILCRSSKAKERQEWQADFFSACLLMPRRLVWQKWREFYHRGPIVFSEIRHKPAARRSPRKGLVHIGEVMRKQFEAEEDYLFNNILYDMAGEFRVSTQAMRIRLESLGLLQVEPNLRLFASNFPELS